MGSDRETLNGMEGVRAIFTNSDGEQSQGWEAIVPICRRTRSGIIECLGTGFFITYDILVTAAHVLCDFISTTDYLLIFQYLPVNRFAIRYITKVTHNLRHDVAIFAVQTQRDAAAGLRRKNKYLGLTRTLPSIGDEVHTWAFPRTVHEFNGKNGSLKFVPKLYTGFVEEEHPDGRDRIVLPGRCYRTTLAIEGGASGGPVFNKDGRVFAVNSTGFEGTDVGYVSHIQSIGGLPIQKFMTPDGEVHDQMTISTMIERGLIRIE